MRRLATSLTLAIVIGSVFVPAAASPVCAEEPRALCGGRIFPEADTTVSFVQHDSGEYEAGIKALAAEFPRFVKVRTFSEILGTETLSAGGREIYMVEITDFEVPESGKVPVAISMSVHGPERAGLEGGVRYMEDLARWAKDEPDHELRNGTNKDSVGMPVSRVLRQVHLYLADINPDGWAAGDITNGGVFTRGNANGPDLNRQFPTMGWTKVSGRPLPMTEPEPIAWRKIMNRVDPVVTTDIHGELTSAQNAFADMMYPAGQWNPLEQARQERAARHMKTNVARWFEQQGVEAGTVSGVAGMQPAEYATGFDVVGYDDSGFMGDWFTQAYDAIDMDVEHFFSHMVPNSTWVSSLEEAHIAAVRGEIESLMVEAIVADEVEVQLRLGKVGYLFDPKVAKIADGYGGPDPPKGEDPRPYHSTRMAYFRALSRFSTAPLRKVWSNDLAAGLRGLDTFVIADKPYPRTRSGKKPVAADVGGRLKAFVKNGGNLILTDRGLRLLGRLGVVPKKSVTGDVHGAGHIDILDFEDLYLKNVHSTASQTYYEVPLGFTLDKDSAPHWTVERTAWEGADGKTLAFVGEEDRVALGRVSVGKGTIGIFGAILPQPTERFDHLYGLADYAVTVAGGQILNNMIRFGLR